MRQVRATQVPTSTAAAAARCGKGWTYGFLCGLTPVLLLLPPSVLNEGMDTFGMSGLWRKCAHAKPMVSTMQWEQGSLWSSGSLP